VTADGVPFEILDPARSASGNDVIVLKGGMAQDWACKVSMPQRVEIPVGRALERVHVLGGVAAWGFPYTRERPDCVRWTWNYADGETEEVLLTDGVQFADWIRPSDVPGSKQVEGLLEPGTRGQLRRFSVAPSRDEEVRSITLESFDNQTAPTFLAMTAQLEPGVVSKGELWDVTDVAVVAPELEVVVTKGERPARIVGGGTSHDYAAWYRGADAQTLAEAGFGPIAYTDEPSLALGGLDGVPLLVLSNNMPLPADARGAVFEHVDGGGGLLLLHAATWYNWADWPEYNRELVGGGSRGHESYQEFEVEVVAPDHPITAGLPATWRVADELYRFERDEAGPELEVLAIGRSLETGEEYPVAWVVPREGGRVVCITLGHDGAAHGSAEYQRLLQNAARWAAPSE
jgi:type 1 glutamine amidotransferase